MKLLLPVLMTLCGQLIAQTITPSTHYKDQELGYEFVPPAGMIDRTSAEKRLIEQRAAQLHTSKVLTLRLALRANVRDTDAEWHSVGIESYPREQFANSNDHDAILKMSRWVAGQGAQSGEISDRGIGGFNFVVSTFELHEGPLIKRARVYTTILKGQLLSIAFSANSPKQLAEIEKSMNTFTGLERR